METNANPQATIAIICAVVLACALGVCLIIMLRKKIIKPETLTHAAELLDGVAVSGSGFVANLAEYARIAVHAVEQLAKTGIISGGTDKKEAAMDYVRQLAQTDKVPLSPDDLKTADVLIEAAVNELPRNQSKGG